jgi:ERCC4-type nuclease
MVFQNIFSKKKAKQKNLPKIIIDFREKNSLVPSEILKLNLEIGFKSLKVGDYLIKNTIIERKTILDLISSIIDKRIFKQLEEIKQYPSYLILIEGSFENLNDNRIKGFLLSCALKFQVPIIFSKNEKDTANYIKILANKKEKTIQIKPQKKANSPNQELEIILEPFPKIGPATSKKLLKEFGSIKKIFNSQEENLKKILGNNSEKFIEIINREYSFEKK